MDRENFRSLYTKTLRVLLSIQSRLTGPRLCLLNTDLRLCSDTDDELSRGNPLPMLLTLLRRTLVGHAKLRATKYATRGTTLSLAYIRL